jgi:GNAT superfamily N-acetyltransferase
MNAAVVIRPAQPEDAAAVARVHAESWRITYRGILPDAYLDGPVYAERLQLWTDRLALPDAQRPFVRLAEADAPAGFVCVLRDDHPRWGLCLDNLHVLPAFRSLGIGRALMAEAARWAVVTAPGRPLHLWVFAANRAAIDFYECLGAEPVEHRIKAPVAGMTAPSIRYCWDDPDVLRLRLQRD